MKLGWTVYFQFGINLHVKDKQLLELVQSYLNVGNITPGKQKCQFRVTSIKELEVIINHFDNYPLMTQKLADFLLFKQALDLFSRKEHLTLSGLHKIVAIKASMNRGLSDKLKAAFPNTIPVQRPLVNNQEIRDPNWVCGFTSGEGCFMVKMMKSITHKMNEQVLLKFALTQHSRDELLMKSLLSYLGCGRYEPQNSKDFGEFVITKFLDLTDKIIPFFQKYPVQGVKHLDFLDFVKVAEIIKEKGHLTEEGLSKIRKIKKGMNTGRKFAA